MGSGENYITVHHGVYHQRAGHQPQGMDGRGDWRWTREVVSGQPSLVSEIVVGPDWTQLPLGAMESVGMVTIINKGGPPRDTLPTAEEAREMAAQVLEVSLRSVTMADLEINPGESQPITPSRPTILLRSRTGVRLRVSYHVVPR